MTENQTPDPRAALEDGPVDPSDFIRAGVQAARDGQFERGLMFLSEAYRKLSKDNEKLPPMLLSYYGVCLALNKGRAKEAAEFCQLAVEKEFYNAELYLNLARVYVAARSRRKAVEALERGLAIDGRHQQLLKLRQDLGFRKRPVIPFLGRENTLNVTLGRMRQRMKKEPGTAAGKPGPPKKG